jgi:hypothetical protein
LSVKAKPLDESIADAQGTMPEIGPKHTIMNDNTTFFIVCSYLS